MLNKILLLSLFVILTIILPNICRAMPPGALLYRTSSNGKMYGYSGDSLVEVKNGILKNIYPGHVGIYIGKENGVDYVVEALSNGIVKTPADKFVNEAEGEKYLGAKIPKGLSAIRQAKVVALAKSLVGKNLAYDFDFKTQKGPESGQWTCVGLSEKLYESADISNPNNLSALEYDFNYYAIDITADGFDNSSVVNSEGDCFSKDREFSKIARRKNLILPAPELFAYDLGLERNGDRYLFLPYTQFLQSTLEDVKTDITISSSFSGAEIRESVNTLALVLRWSLLNNPISFIKNVTQKAKDIAVNIKNSIFGQNSGNEELTLSNVAEKIDPEAETLIKVGAVVNKATKEKTKIAIEPKKTKASTSKVILSKENNPGSFVKVNKSSTAVKTSSANKPDIKIATTNKSSSTISTYYNPVKTPSISVSNNSSSSGASGSWSSSTNAASDNFPRIATINKIYSTGNNNWIELYNPGEHDFDLATASYRLEKAKTAEDPALIMRIGDPDDGTYPGGTIIKSHDTYLIVKDTADSYYLSKADAIAIRDDFKWPGSAYTLYLGTGAISSNIDPDIVEAIGFGEEATYYQGFAPAPEIKNNYILKRIKNTNDNSADFNLIKSDDPNIDWESLNKVASSSEINNSSIATSSEVVSTSTENISSSTISVSSSSLILINKIYGTALNDFVELYNPNNFDFDLATNNYRLEKAKTTQDPGLLMRIGNPDDGTYPGGTIIKPHGNYLIARSEANNFYKSGANAIATRADFTWSDSGYTLYLGNGAISSSTDQNIIDMVGFGDDATYWRGGGPAKAISDNYILSRISNTSNNSLDFDLIKSDDPSIDWSIGSTSIENINKVYNFSSDSYNLFPKINPIDSPGLVNLWHFDECSGIDSNDSIGSTTLSSNSRWLAGKFVCAKELGSGFDKISGSFNKQVDVNNFSLSFWFKGSQSSPRLSVTLSTKDGDSINVTLENDLMQFSGLPNDRWRYYEPFAFDDIWRQATLVINRNEGYWALYIDGVERMHIPSYKLYPSFDKIELGGNNGSYAIDELAIWNRALSQDEIIELRAKEQPLNPFIISSQQERPVLKYFWNLNEGIGTSSTDLISGLSLPFNNNYWDNLDLVNSALIVNWGNNINIKFPQLSSRDLSLTFWWRSNDTNIGNRMKVALRNDSENNILALYPNQFFSAYNFNNNYYRSGSSVSLDTNWHQIALVYDSYRNLLSYYTDGELKESRSDIWSKSNPIIDGLEILSENGVSEIDNLGIWEGALSHAQIKQIFANN